VRLEVLMLRLFARLGALSPRLARWLRIPVLIALVVVIVALCIVLAIPVLIWRILRGLWYRVFPPPLTRDVSRLGDEGDFDAVAETVADEGQPLKEHHHRTIARDPRLLPKRKPPDNVWPRPRRRKVMTFEDATRLFGATLRTKNRRIRDLLADEEQLQRYGLPLWKTEQDVADALDVSLGTLRHFSIHRDAEPVTHYVTFRIPKRNGQSRLIMAPKSRLKHIQRLLLRALVDKLPVSPHAHGFRSGRSIRSGAEPHVGKAVVLKMDLKDFFPSVTFGRVRGLLIALGYGYPVATTLAVLMTEAERQPVELDGRVVHVPVGPRHCVQGAPTSPGVCNALCLRLDRRLAGLARKYGWTYTRYADDLTFSGDSAEHAQTIRRLATRVCNDEGFQVHPDKTRVMRRGSRQTVTGVVVNRTAGLSRRERRLLRATIHRLKRGAPDKPATLTETQIRGKLAYLRMLNADQAAALARRM
jgi:retron-type reverse transcriptase